MIEKDQYIWERFLSGDEDAYIYIYNKYAQAMFTYGIQFTSDKEIVKDCIHDVFVKIHSDRQKLQTTTNIKFYLFVALKNTLYNTFRKHVPLSPLEFSNDTLTDSSTAEDALLLEEAEQQKKQQLTDLLEILSPRQKEVLYYRYIEELSFEEIETLMQINYQSIQNLIHRSFKKIRKTFPDLLVFYLLYLKFFNQ